MQGGVKERSGPFILFILKYILLQSNDAHVQHELKCHFLAKTFNSHGLISAHLIHLLDNKELHFMQKKNLLLIEIQFVHILTILIEFLPLPLYDRETKIRYADNIPCHSKSKAT